MECWNLKPCFYAEGEDYAFDSVPPVINILSGMSRGCLTITIIQSDLVEDTESIDLLINETTTMANVLEERTTVIIDADGGMKNNSSLYLLTIFFHCLAVQPIQNF